MSDWLSIRGHSEDISRKISSDETKHFEAFHELNQNQTHCVSWSRWGEANQESGECQLWLSDTSHWHKERRRVIILKSRGKGPSKYMYTYVFADFPSRCINSSSSDQWSIVRSPATPEMVLASAGYYRNSRIWHVTHSPVLASHWSQSFSLGFLIG